METLSRSRACQHTTIRVATRRPIEFVDLTEQLVRHVDASGLRVGMLAVQTRHTTTAIVLNEHEPLLLADFEALFERMVPERLAYWHDELALRSGIPADEPRNAHAHCRALVLPSSAVVVVVDGRMQLGRWQRVFLVEFDGPREREVAVVSVGEGAL